MDFIKDGTNLESNLFWLGRNRIQLIFIWAESREIKWDESRVNRHCQRFYTFEREERKENNIVADEHCSKCT